MGRGRGRHDVGWPAVAAGIVLLAAVAWPAASPGGDSFPLSDYPMFAAARPTTTTFATVVRHDGEGTRRLDPLEIGGTDQVMQAAATVAQAVRRGEAGRLCAEIAARQPGPAEIEIASETLDTVAWFRGDREPLARTVHARCAAP